MDESITENGKGNFAWRDYPEKDLLKKNDAKMKYLTTHHSDVLAKLKQEGDKGQQRKIG